MFEGFSLKKTFTQLIVVVNILLLVLMWTLFRSNISKSEKNLHKELTLSIASEINDYYKKKVELIRSISSVESIVHVSMKNQISNRRLVTSNFNSIKTVIGSSVLYLMNSSGLVIGSSVYRGSKTLLGNNYKFRPYFKEALEGKNSFYVAVGVTTGERGMYFGFPVREKGKVTGVVVIKFNLSFIDKIIEKAGIPGGMVSPDGIIFSTTVKKWFYNSTRLISSGGLKEINSSKQLGEFHVKNFPHNIEKDSTLYKDENYFISKTDLEIDGWSFFTFYLPNLKINYVYPALIFFILMIIELLVINSIKEFYFRRASRIAIRESRERFQYLFESAVDSILILDNRKTIIDFNPASSALFGYSMRELVGKKFNILFHGDYQCVYETQMRTVELELKERFEFRGRNKDGKDIFIDCSAVYFQGDETDTYFIICSDITRRKEAEAILKNAKEEAEKANLAKGEFLANMSHEIRTPMTAILGFSDLLESSILSKKQKEYVEIIKNSGESLLYLIDEILDFSKIEAGKVLVERKNFDFRKFLMRIEKTTNVWIKNRDIKLSFIVGNDIPKFLVGDPERLKQILRNLLNNAVKFTDKGEVKLEIKMNKVVNPWVSIMFSVQDTGIGISKDDTNKLFKSFSQIDSALSRKYEGTGLGLAITAKLVEMMGGNLKMESNLGKGSKFYFSINLGKGNLADENNRELVGTGLRTKIHKDLSNYSILVVEDNKVNRMLLDYTLKREGFEVVTAINGDNALNLLRKRAFSVILMDIQMPGKDGVEVTKEIKKTSRKTIPVIALTANAMKGDREKYIGLGMDDYLSKPIKKRELLNTVIKWIVKSKE